MEKVSEREPDILIIEMKPCRMVTSGLISDENTFHHFNSMWMKLGARVADKINPRDFMYDDEEHQKPVWLFMLEDWITEADTDGFSIITFDGGLYAAALADSWEAAEYERVYNGIKAWLTRQEGLELDEGSKRYTLKHFAGPHSELIKQYGKVRYFVPIKLIP